MRPRVVGDGVATPGHAEGHFGILGYSVTEGEEGRSGAGPVEGRQDRVGAFGTGPVVVGEGDPTRGAFFQKNRTSFF